MALLSHEHIQQIHAAVVEARLSESREALLTGMDPHFSSTLEASPAPGEQILRDLDAINHAGELSDGSVPLRIWLTNARNLAGPRVQAGVFRRALTALEGLPRARVSSSPPSALLPRNNLPPR